MKSGFVIKLLFIIYLIILVDFTLVSDTFGRDIFNVLGWSSGGFAQYSETSINLVPFATVKLMINGVINNNLTVGIFLINLLGNFILLMPFGYFLPVCTGFNNTFLKYLCSVTVIAFSIESLQLVFLTGSCDIDDFILNVTGAIISYFIFKSIFKSHKSK